MTWMSSAPVTVNLCLHQISRACYLSTLWPALDVSIFMKYFWNISNDLLLLVSLCPTCVRPEVKESSKQFSHRVMSWGSLEQPRADWDPLLRAKSTTYTHSISPDSIFSSGSSPVISIKRIKYSADTASSLSPGQNILTQTMQGLTDLRFTFHTCGGNGTRSICVDLWSQSRNNCCEIFEVMFRSLRLWILMWSRMREIVVKVWAESGRYVLGVCVSCLHLFCVVGKGGAASSLVLIDWPQHRGCHCGQ